MTFIPLRNQKNRASNSISISITDEKSGIKNKTITHYQGDKNVPEKLMNLEEKIDEITNSKKWIDNPSKVSLGKRESSSKQVETIVSKHEKSSNVRKKPSNLKKKIIAAIFVIIILFFVLYLIQTGFDKLAINKGDDSNNVGIPKVTITATPLSGFKPLTVNFSGNGENFIGLISYEWDFGNGIISNEQNPEHIYYSTGVYDVKLIISDENDVNASNIIQVNVSEKDVNEPFVVYILTDPLTPNGAPPLNISLVV